MDQVYDLSRGFLVALPEAVEAALPGDSALGPGGPACRSRTRGVPPWGIVLPREALIGEGKLFFRR